MGITIIDRDLGFKRITKQIKALDKKECGIGLYGDGDPKTNLAARGVVNEFGSEKMNIPKRSFMRSTFDKKQRQWWTFSNKIFTRFLKGTINNNKLLNTIGARIKSDIQFSIESNIPPANHPITIARKKSSKTLIHSGEMDKGIDYRIRKKGK